MLQGRIYNMSHRKKYSKLLAWKVLPVLVILMYFVGMVLMIFGQFGNGVTLWALSTVIGGLMLYVRRTNEKKLADAKQMEEEERAYQQKLKEVAQKQEQ